MAEDKLGISLQQNLLTILCYDDVNGKVVANLVDPSLFETDYRVLAERTVDHWRKFGTAPKLHSADLVSDIIDDNSNRRAPAFKRILLSMMELAESVNSNYVMDQLKTFTRLQRVKGAILKSAEQINSQHEFALDEVEHIWNNLLRTQDDTFDAGLKLTDLDRVISYLENRQEEFTSGIEQLDKRHVTPARGTATLIIGGAGMGKTWMMINYGKQALLQRKRVLHITLEMGEEQVAQRYYQALFSISKRERSVGISTLETNSYGQLIDIDTENVKPEFTFEKLDVARDELEAHINLTGTKLTRLLIKRFSGLTVEKLRGYLDNLEATQNFIPDMIILDYLGLMKITGNEYRLSLGNTFKEVRDILIERNIAGIIGQQGSKEGVRSDVMDTTNVAEDWSLIGTADMAITYSQTEKEKLYGLARLYVGKARDELDKFIVLISQNYRMGQFALESAMMTSRYKTLLKELPDDDETDDDEIEEDD